MMNLKKILSFKVIEIALNVYKKNKKQNRHSILQNYLSESSSSLKNKYKVEQAVKNINNELEEAKNQLFESIE